MGCVMNTMNNLWQFSQIPNIEESNFNKILERFYSLGVAGLTRENIQNSLDGRLNDQPVTISIILGETSQQNIPGIESIIERIHNLEGHNSYTKDTIDHMKESILEDKVRYISFEDSNTRGLTGAKYGQSNSKDHTWGIYAYNKGVHPENNDEKFEASRGGSHGVGKIASNAASDLHMMFFSNCDKDGEEHLGGTVQLIEHQYKNDYYRSTGYFARSENQKFMPFHNTFNEIFQKKTRGLKIIIPFLREDFYKEKEIICSVCDSFFVSILKKKLIVHIKNSTIDSSTDLIIDSSTIEAIVNNPEYYEQDISAMKKNFTPLYVRTYTKEEPQTIKITNGKTEYQFKLYFNYDEQIPKGRVAIIRTIGMKIEDFMVKNNSTKPFNCILIGSEKEDSYLKSLENESHTKISSEDIKNPDLKKHAKKFINNLTNELIKTINDAIRKQNPVDGKINTSDLIYTRVVSFKENLEEAFGTIKIKNGRNLVVSGEGNPSDKAPITETRQKKKNKNSVKRKDSGIRRKSSGLSDGNNENAIEDFKEEYKINSHRVERLLMGDKEIIRLNLSGDNSVSNAKNCNLKFNIVDGMGKEYMGEFNLAESYITAIDKNTNMECIVEKDGLKNVSIKNGYVNLELSLQKIYNRSLKFIYYVEV